MKAFSHPFTDLRHRMTGFFIGLLTTPLKSYTPRFPNDLVALKRSLRRGDVLLIEGNQPMSEIIKYLTQSSWSHTAIYVGDEFIRRNHPLAPAFEREFGEDARYLLVEALLPDGVVASPLTKYANFTLRVCRPSGLRRPEDLQTVLDEVIGQLGLEYDVKNILDLARHLFPVHVLPQRFRRKPRPQHFGSNSPMQVICSSLIARAFSKIGFPILPHLALGNQPERQLSPRSHRSSGDREGQTGLLRHPSLITPCDFDLSPHFEIVKFAAVD
jgi:hypothetical protein